MGAELAVHFKAPFTPICVFDQNMLVDNSLSGTIQG